MSIDILTYSEARQKLARVLDRAESTGKVLIRRKDGRTFALTPEKNQQSPLDVPSIRVAISTKELVRWSGKKGAGPEARGGAGRRFTRNNASRAGIQAVLRGP